MTDMSKASLRWLIATTLILTWGCGSSDQGDLAPGAEVTIEMPDGSLVTGRVAQPAVDGQPAGDGESVATVEKVAEDVASREPAAWASGIQALVDHEGCGGARGWAPRSKVSTMIMRPPQHGQG